MEHSKDKLSFPAKVDQYYFQGGGALMLNIAFSSVYNLITLVSLDVTFLWLWTLLLGVSKNSGEVPEHERKESEHVQVHR
jgi:hypothetical protein